MNDPLVVRTGDTVMSECPNCGSQSERIAYDVGSGPELSCASCEWCWGANGQDLKPLDLHGIQEALRRGEPLP